MENKPRVMLHYILPPNTSGPNTSMERIEKSWLKDHYTFGKLVQDERPGKIFNIKLLKKMVKQVKDFKPDIVHISGLQSAGFYAVFAARMGGCRNIITTVRGSATENIRFNPTFKFIFGNIIEPGTMMLSKRVYTVCNHLSEKFKIYQRNNFAGVIHNPAPIIDLEKLDHDEFRERNKINKDKTVVSIVGRMVYDKGISFAIEAIKNINNPDIVFVFVGDGPYCEIIENELKNEIDHKRVFVLGKRNDVLNILAGSDIFLFPTLHENLSNALLEACVLRLAVVATSVGGNKEVITNEVNGLLIPPFDSTSIKNSVLRLHNNKDEMKKLGKEAKINVDKNFSQEKIFSRVKDLYDNLLS